MKMNILNDLIANLNPQTKVRDIRLGVFQTAVLTRHCGLASTLPRDALRQEPPMVHEPGSLLDKSVRELVEMAYSESILEAVVGMATINSLIDIDMKKCLDLNAGDLIAEKGEGKKVAIVGHFPFIPRLRKQVRKLWVIEKNPREGDYAESEAKDLIPQADVVGITGTALTNHTLDQLLAFCTPKTYVVLLGDTAPFSPIMFDYGVDAISGTQVQDANLTLKCVSQGASFRQIKGTRRLTMMR